MRIIHLKQTIYLGTFSSSFSYCDGKQTCVATLCSEKQGHGMSLNPLELKFWVSLEGRTQKPEDVLSEDMGHLG